FGVFFMAKYSEDFKLSVVLGYEAGNGGYRALSQRFGVDHATVRRWIKSYQMHGVEGLRKKSSRYSAQFKLLVLQRIQQDELSVRQALALFNIRGGVGVITEWKRRYHEQGLAGIQPKPRGRPKKMIDSKPPKSVTPLVEDTRSREELVKENEYLRAEVAYLKKLRALRQAKEQAAQKKRG